MLSEVKHETDKLIVKTSFFAGSSASIECTGLFLEKTNIFSQMLRSQQITCKAASYTTYTTVLLFTRLERVYHKSVVLNYRGVIL